MTFACMIIRNKTITRLTKSFVIRSLFQYEILEIEVVDPTTIEVYLQNVKDEKLWQAVAILESEGLSTVYHFSSTKKEALHEARKHLDTVP